MNAPLRRSRPYIFWGQTTSLCETCLALVPAKIQILGNEVWYEKRCRAARRAVDPAVDRRGLLAAVQGLHQAGRQAARLPEPHRIRLPVRLRAVPGPRAAFLPGADRDQRALQSHLPGVLCRIPRRRSRSTSPLDTIERMLDALVASEGEPDLVQISGGEPTLHPEFFAHPRRGARAADPPRDDQHQRPAHRAGAGFRRAAGRAQARARDLPAVRFARARRADEPARRRSAPRAAGGAGEPRAPRHLDHAGRDGEARRQRRRDRRDRAPRARMALRARRHVPAGAGRRTQREFRPQARPRAAVRHPRARDRGLRRVRRRRHDPAAVQSGAISIGYGLRNGRSGAAGHLAGAARGARRRDAEHDQLREAAGAEGEVHRPVLALVRAEQRGRAAARVPVLPAQGAGAGGARPTRTCSASRSCSSWTASISASAA